MLAVGLVLLATFNPVTLPKLDRLAKLQKVEAAYSKEIVDYRVVLGRPAPPKPQKGDPAEVTAKYTAYQLEMEHVELALNQAARLRESLRAEIEKVQRQLKP